MKKPSHFSSGYFWKTTWLFRTFTRFIFLKKAFRTFSPFSTFRKPLGFFSIVLVLRSIFNTFSTFEKLAQNRKIFKPVGRSHALLPCKMENGATHTGISPYVLHPINYHCQCLLLVRWASESIFTLWCHMFKFHGGQVFQTLRSPPEGLPSHWF